LYITIYKFPVAVTVGTYWERSVWVTSVCPQDISWTVWQIEIQV